VVWGLGEDDVNRRALSGPDFADGVHQPRADGRANLEPALDDAIQESAFLARFKDQRIAAGAAHDLGNVRQGAALAQVQVREQLDLVHERDDVALRLVEQFHRIAGFAWLGHQTP